MEMRFISDTKSEVSVFDKANKEWRYPVDLEDKTCSCRQWQITGLPCIHALFFITSISGPAGNIQQYVHDYYSVAMFRATYAHALPALEGKQQWDRVDPGFKLCAPLLKRAAGRPRKTRHRRRNEGGGLGARVRKCTRCGGTGHFGKYCDNTVDPGFGESIPAENDGQLPDADDAAFENDDQVHDRNDYSNDDPVHDASNDPLDAPVDAPVHDASNDPLDAPVDDPLDDPVEVSFSDGYVNPAMISLVFIFHLS